MEVHLRMTPDIKKLLAELGGDMDRGLSAGMENLLETLEAHAVEEAPVLIGNLVNTITHYITDGGRTGVLKATAPYAKFVHEGTGIFGPLKKKIVPTTKKALFWPGARHPVKSVKGMRPRPFFRIAIERTDVNAEFAEGIGNYLRRRGW